MSAFDYGEVARPEFALRRLQHEVCFAILVHHIKSQVSPGAGGRTPS